MSKFYTVGNKAKFLFLLLLLGTKSVQSEVHTPKEGGATSGGGDVLVCQGSFGFSDLFFADTIDLFKSEKGIFSKKRGVLGLLNKEMKSKDTEEILEILTHSTKSIDFDFSKVLQSQLRKIQSQIIWVDNLEELNGDQIQIPKGCSKKMQLAIQDTKKGILRIHRKRYDSMSNWEKAFFLFHEALIKVRNPGLNSTPVRKEVFELVNSYSFSLFAMLLLRIETAKEGDDVNPQEEIKATFEYLKIRRTNEKAAYNVRMVKSLSIEVLEKYIRKEDFDALRTSQGIHTQVAFICISEKEVLFLTPTVIGRMGGSIVIHSPSGALYVNQVNCNRKDWKKSYPIHPEVRRFFSIESKIK